MKPTGATRAPGSALVPGRAPAFTLIELLVVIAIIAILANPGRFSLLSFPGSYHSGAGNFSFADGHVESHKWLAPTTRPPITGTRVWWPLNESPSPRNSDVHWLQERTFQRAD